MSGIPESSQLNPQTAATPAVGFSPQLPDRLAIQAYLIQKQTEQLQRTDFFGLDMDDTFPLSTQSTTPTSPESAGQSTATEVKARTQKSVGIAYLRFEKSFRVGTWQAFNRNQSMINSELESQLPSKQQSDLNAAQTISALINSSRAASNKNKISTNISTTSFTHEIKRKRDEIYTGGVYKPVNSYVQINEPIDDEKTKYLYLDQESIGLKRSDQIQYQQQSSTSSSIENLRKHSSQNNTNNNREIPSNIAGGNPNNNMIAPISCDKFDDSSMAMFVTKQSEHVIKCVMREVQQTTGVGANLAALKFLQRDVLHNSDFRIPQLWWRTFAEQNSQLMASKYARMENERRYKVHVFKFGYFFCNMCLQYNCITHRSLTRDPPLRNENWTPLFDKNIPRHMINSDRVREFINRHNGFNYAYRYTCPKTPPQSLLTTTAAASHTSECYRNPQTRKNFTPNVHSHHSLNKRWIHALFYFAKTFSFLNPCLITLILNMSRPPKTGEYSCCEVANYILNGSEFSYSRMKNEIQTYMKVRAKEFLKEHCTDEETGEIYDNALIVSKFGVIPSTRSELLVQLNKLSELLNGTYTPCFHEGVCESESACRCYRNRDIIERMNKRLDKLKLLDRKDKKHIRKALELSFENEGILLEQGGSNATNIATGSINTAGITEDLENEDDSYLEFSEKISKYLHECEIYCGCLSLCRGKIRKLGCNCLNDLTCISEKQCQCRVRNRECDPEVCRCFCNRNARTIQRFGLGIEYCSNSQARYNCKTRVLLGKSLVCDGLGLFAGQDFKKNAYIGSYFGELINEKQGTERQDVQQPQGISYLFMVNGETDVDSFRYGNKMRFVNHNCGSMANCKVDIIFCRGMNLVRFNANSDIAKGQEIYFDYNRNYKIEWMTAFNDHFDKFEADEKKSPFAGYNSAGNLAAQAAAGSLSVSTTINSTKSQFRIARNS